MDHRSNPPIAIDFHGQVSVDVAQPTESLRGQCHRLFGRFIVNKTTGTVPDIRIEPLNRETSRWASPVERKNADALVVIERDGRPLVVHGYGRRVDVLADPGDPIRLLYRPDQRGSQKVVGRLFVYLQMALRRRGGLLFKGAALVKEGRCVVLTGFSGAGKTSLLIEMLASGWDFLSDDTFIFADGRACIFRPFIVLNQHHFDLLSAAGASAGRPPALRAAGVRRILRGLLMNSAPLALEQSERLQRLCDPRFRVDPLAMRPDCAIVDAARPTALWIVRPGERAGVRALSQDDALRRVEAIQRLTYDEFERVRACLTVFTGTWCSPPEGGLLHAHLQGVPAFEVAIAPGGHVGRLADLLAAGLSGGEAASHSPLAPPRAEAAGRSASGDRAPC